MTVVVVAASGGARAQQWVDRLEGRGHDVYLVAPSSTEIRATHHVTTTGETADVVRALADALEGVRAPVLLLAAESLGSGVTVDEVEAASGTVVLSTQWASGSDQPPDSGDAPLRVIAGVVVAAGSGVHQVGEPTHRSAGLLRVDDADVDAVADALHVMSDVAAQQQWQVGAWPLVVVAAVRAGVTVRTITPGGLPWGEEVGSVGQDEENLLRVSAAAGAPQGVVDR